MAEPVMHLPAHQFFIKDLFIQQRFQYLQKLQFLHAQNLIDLSFGHRKRKNGYDIQHNALPP